MEATEVIEAVFTATSDDSSSGRSAVEVRLTTPALEPAHVLANMICASLWRSALVRSPWSFVISPHSQPTAYCAHVTQPTVPSAERSPSATGVGRRSARVGGSGAALWAAHPHTRLGRAGRARGVSRARRTCGSRRGSPQPGSRAAAPAGAQPPPPPRAAPGCCPTRQKSAYYNSPKKRKYGWAHGRHTAARL